jgi:asparagine synthase (glutamine-hydrolysing)
VRDRGSQGGAVHSMVNGEIYGFRALRDELLAAGVALKSTGDAEVVPHLYARQGIAGLERLDGMFALALVDVAAQRLVLIRDRFGKKPLYYRVKDGVLEFASEAKALLAAADARVDPDPAAILRFLTFGYVPGDGSAFRGLRRLRPGERLIADRTSGAVTIERWYRAPLSTARSIAREEAIAELAARLDSAVERRLQSDVPLGVFLSGGIDSGLILASAVAATRRAGAPPPLAFTIGFDDPALDERPLARATASHLRIPRLIEHVAVPRAEEALLRIVRTFDEPFGDASAYPTLLVCELARRDVTVALSGDGGDEAFAGYKRHRAMRDAARFGAIVPRALRRVFASLLGEAGNGVAGRGFVGQFRRFAAALGLDAAERNAYWSTYFRAPLRARFLAPDFLAAAGCDPDAEASADYENAIGSPLRRTLRVDLERYLPDDLLVKTDLASMVHSLEVRCPFLDREVVEFASTLQDDLLCDGALTKVLPRALAARRLPPAVATASKRGFGVPLAAWLRGPLRAIAEDRLLSPRFAARGILREGAARELIVRHGSGREDWSSYLFLLLVLEEWYRRHVDRER